MKHKDGWQNQTFISISKIFYFFRFGFKMLVPNGGGWTPNPAGILRWADPERPEAEIRILHHRKTDYLQFKMIPVTQTQWVLDLRSLLLLFIRYRHPHCKKLKRVSKRVSGTFWPYIGIRVSNLKVKMNNR